MPAETVGAVAAARGRAFWRLARKGARRRMHRVAVAIRIGVVIAEVRFVGRRSGCDVGERRSRGEQQHSGERCCSAQAVEGNTLHGSKVFIVLGTSGLAKAGRQFARRPLAGSKK